MKSFTYEAPKDLSAALTLLDRDDEHAILGGGTDLLSAMKDEIEMPETLIDVSRLKELNFIDVSGPAIRIGATTPLADLIASSELQKAAPSLVAAASLVATPQIRNHGTLGGNLNQRPRCWYFRSSLFPCYRKGGEECFAVLGENRYHAILGGAGCFIVHPSDLAPVLISLGASAILRSSTGSREVPLEDYYIGPEVDIRRETVLAPQEVLSEVRIPEPTRWQGAYVKARGRETWDFMTTSAAVALRMESDLCREARICLGGVAPKPWRAPEAETVLKGQKLTAELIGQAAAAAVKLARPMQYNAYKVGQVQSVLARALRAAAGMEAES